MSELVVELLERTSRNNPQERESWQHSLPQLSRVLRQTCALHPSTKDVHLNLGHVALEYRLPSASAWCDAVLLANNRNGRPQALIIELKHWDTSADTPGLRECLMERRQGQEPHPSDQVRGYTEYCRGFHSAVQEHQAVVDGCVFFTRPGPIKNYRLKPNDRLVAQFPIFGIYDEPDVEKFTSFIAAHASNPNSSFAELFVKGRYKQDRRVLVQVATALRESSARPFVLLDAQRHGFNMCLAALKRKRESASLKQVIIIKGPPGSGKSALAVNLWIECAQKFDNEGNVVFVTTSSCQSTNWQHVFNAYGHTAGANFLAITSNNFNPGLTGKIVSSLRRKGHPMDYHDWRDCIRSYVEEGYTIQTKDNEHGISIVDEAHALINPETHNIGFPSGWCVQAGPQAHHIIRCSRISIFLADSRQSYRDNETTSAEDLERFAKELGAEVTHLSLEGAQFRCGGSVEYLDWAEKLLSGDPIGVSACRWRKTAEMPQNLFSFEILPSPFESDAQLRELSKEGELVRLVSSYSVPWISNLDPRTEEKFTDQFSYESHMRNLDPEDCDFQIPIEGNGVRRVWSRPWNFAPSEDYTFFIQAVPGSMMSEDPLSEVGCPYVLRGFDYDYLGLLWLSDLVWRKDRWKVQIAHVHETAIKSTLAAARGEIEAGNDDGPGGAELLERVVRAYRILLTRAIKGIYVFVQDRETREHLQLCLNK